MLQLITKHFRPFMVGTPKGDKAEASKVKLAKWRRKDGLASFIADMIALRKPLQICHFCAERRMPSRWRNQYNYEKFNMFRGGESACDYCREEKPLTLYMATDNELWRTIELGEKSVAETRKRERLQYERDSRYILR